MACRYLKSDGRCELESEHKLHTLEIDQETGFCEDETGLLCQYFSDEEESDVDITDYENDEDPVALN